MEYAEDIVEVGEKVHFTAVLSHHVEKSTHMPG